MTDPPQLERNLRAYPFYVAGSSALAWAPVFFLYFNSIVPLDRVLQLEAVYYATVVLLEVPSGYLSDAVGRVLTLRIAATALLVAYVLFWLARGLTGLVAAQVLLAVGISFNSGTDASFHYDNLACLGRELEFTGREARAVRIGLLSAAIAAVAGGLVGTLSLGSPYLLSGGFALVSVGAAGVMVEPPRDPGGTRLGARRALAFCAATLRRPSLRWLFVVGVLTTVLNHVPYELYQPYIDRALSRIGEQAVATPPMNAWSAVPAVTGLHTTAALLLAAWAASRSAALRERAGTALALLVPVALQAALIGVMARTVSIAVVPLLLLRIVPRGLLTAPYRDAVLSRLPRARRATWLSIESLAGRLAFAAFLAIMSLIATPATSADTGTLLTIARSGFALGLVGLAWLMLRRGAITEAP